MEPILNHLAITTEEELRNICNFILIAFNIPHPSPGLMRFVREALLKKETSEIKIPYEYQPHELQNMSLSTSSTTNLIQSGSTSQFSFAVTYEDFSPGFDYQMFGALHQDEFCDLPGWLWSDPLTKTNLPPEDDNTVCLEHWDRITSMMPFYLLNIDLLRKFNVFQFDDILNDVDDQFTTTVLGLELALEEVAEIDLDAPERDEMLLDAIAKRGGYCPSENDVGVIYPEDLIPYVGPEDQRFDEEYWYEISRQGDCWDEIWLGDGA